MATIRHDGVAVARTSIFHGADRLSTFTTFRRIHIIGPDGTPVEIPEISGNAVRGVWRRTAAWLTWQQLGRPVLPLPAAHAILSGGMLAKTSSGMTPEQIRDIQRLVPIIGLLGSAGGGAMLPGRLNVGGMIPICTETRHLIPFGVDAAPSVDDVLQMEEFSRNDEADLMQPMVDTAVEPWTQQMRYGRETITAGTRLWWSVHTENLFPHELDLLAAVIQQWQTAGGVVGGRGAVGHGRLVLTDLPTELADPAACDRLAGYHDTNRDAIVEALTWLT